MQKRSEATRANLQVNKRILILKLRPFWKKGVYNHECFTGKYTTRKIHTKSYPGCGWRIFIILIEAIPIKCFVYHRPPSREGGSVGRKKKWTREAVWVPVKAGPLSTKAWLRGPFVGKRCILTGLSNV